jgi:phospholipase A1
VNWLFPWSVGYTQKSFWQIYDQQHSRPFRESNYNPELFVDCPSLAWLPDEMGLRSGVEHESNGQSVALSRSWSRAYLWPRYQVNESFEAQLKLWYRFPEKRKRDALDAVGDDNPDIEDYLGYGELYLLAGEPAGHHAQLMVRKGVRDESGTYEINGFFRLTDPSTGGGVSLMLQYFSGYGESLIDYNHRVQKVGLGVAF